MLTLKVAMDELNINQKALVLASGFSKTQISLSLNKGALPVDRDKFRAGVVKLIELYPALQEWLLMRGMTVDDLFLSAHPASTADAPAADLERALCEVAGRAVLMVSVPREVVMGLARATGYLLNQVRERAGAESGPIEIEAYKLLTGGTA